MIPIFSIVAYSGTGKTTLIEKLVPELKKRGKRVAVVKHDAHDFEIDHEGKDSWRMTEAGADVTVIVSEKRAVVMQNREVDFVQLIREIRDVDIILTEGYKHGQWPKIALYRSGNKKPLPLPESDCLAILADVPLETDRPFFDLDNAVALAEFLINAID